MFFAKPVQASSFKSQGKITKAYIGKNCLPMKPADAASLYLFTARSFNDMSRSYKRTKHALIDHIHHNHAIYILCSLGGFIEKKYFFWGPTPT